MYFFVSPAARRRNVKKRNVLGRSCIKRLKMIQITGLYSHGTINASMPGIVLCGASTFLRDTRSQAKNKILPAIM